MPINEKLGTGETITTILTQVSIPDRIVIGWKAWYADGSVYKSSTHKWEDLPVNGIQFLRKFFDLGEGKIGRENCSGHDAYIYDHTKFNEVNSYTMVKLGEYLLDKDYQPIFDQAANDTEDVTTKI